MSKLKVKGFAIFFVIFLLAGAGIIALTRVRGASESQIEQAASANTPRSAARRTNEAPRITEEIPQSLLLPELRHGERWFRSNAGGMALEVSPTRTLALRNPHALVVYHTGPQNLPQLIRPFFNANLLIEVRVLYTDGQESRRQWIFRDAAGRSRLVAVFANEAEPEAGEPYELLSESYENGLLIAQTVIHPDGFIEIYDEDGFIIEEHRFRSDGSITRTFFFYADGAVIRAETWQQVLREEGPVFERLYTDHFRYNRSRLLRSVERVYHDEQRIEIGDNAIRVAFPRHIADIVGETADFIEEQLTEIPQFFGDITAAEGNRAVFDTDERSRVLSQTMLDEDGNILFTIDNTWIGDRIVSMRKLEGGVEFLTEFEFDADGNRIIERNFRNGVLERVVRTQGNREIEELYLNNVLVLEAIWEDGRKISEVRVNR